MKKIKQISIRLSLEEYQMLVIDYNFLKNEPLWTKWLYKEEIKTFSDYIRLMIHKGFNE